MLVTDSVPKQPRFPHLLSAFAACAIPLTLLFVGRFVAIHLEKKTIFQTAPNDFFLKNQGLALQRAAAQTPKVFLLYGSSELTDPIPNRAADFFANGEKGFELCPIGRPGSTPLTMVQRVVALASNLRNKKIAILISPSFFFRRDLAPASYAGNFSLLAADATIFGSHVDSQLKRDIATRMAQFPETLAKSKLLQIAVDRLASGKPLDRIAYTALQPLGLLQNVILNLQDHFETLLYISSGGKTISRRALRNIFQPLEEKAVATDQRARAKAVGSLVNLGPTGFQERISHALGWVDLELLFRALTELRCQVLVLSMPFDGTFYDANGISRSDRQFYYDQTTELAARYQIELKQFEDHDSDSSFQVPHHEHPTAKGWLYYDEVLTEFFRGRQ